MSTTALTPTAPGPAAPAWTGHRRGTAGYRRTVLAMLLAGIATFAQLYSTQALLPRLSADLGVTPAQAALSLSVSTLGLAISVLGWAFVADRIGRTRAMLGGIAVATLLGLLTPLAPTLAAMLLLRFAEGAALGAVPALAIAYLSEEVDRRHGAVVAATYVAGTTVGGLCGRLFAGPIGDLWGWRAGVAAVAVLAAAAAIGFAALLPRARGFTPAPRLGWRRALRAELALVGRQLRDRRLRALYLQAFLLIGGFVAVYNFLTYRLEHPPFGLPIALSSLVFAAYLSGTVSPTAAARLSERFGRRRTMVAAMAVMAVGVLVTLPDRLPLVIVGLVLFTAGFFAAHGLGSGWTGSLASTGRAQASALYNVGYYAGSSMLGWLGGAVYQAWGWPALVLAVAALIALAGTLAAVVHRVPEQR